MTPIVLAKTADMPREEWLKWRRKGIGSSDAAAVVGLHPYQSALDVYLDKIGEAEEEQISEKRQRRMDVGRSIEEFIAVLFECDTGLKVRRCRKILQSRERPFMLANLDYRVTGEDTPVEIKNTEDRRGEWTEDGQAPEYHLIQVHHQLAVTGADHAFLAALINGWNLRIIRVDRDEEIVKLLIEREREFWGHVLERVPPNVDGSTATAETLGRLYKAQKGLAINLAGSYSDAAARHLRAEQKKADAEAEMEAAANEIKAAMAEAVIAVIPGNELIPGVKVSWPEINPEPRLDAERLAQESPAIYSAYLKPSKSYRRFTLKPIKIKEA